MIAPCPRCNGQVLSESCIQCGWTDPAIIDTGSIFGDFWMAIPRSERHTRPLPLSDARTPLFAAASPRKVRR